MLKTFDERTWLFLQSYFAIILSADVKIQTIFKIEFETVNNTKYIRFLDAYSEYSYSDLMVKLDKLLPIKRLSKSAHGTLNNLECFKIVNPRFMFFKLVSNVQRLI